jgi:uncharacterized protein (TIGR02001 family)
MKNLLVIGSIIAASVAPAFAQDAGPTISGNIALATDYTFRGVSQTDESPAVQGGLDLTSGAFYAGTWASNINFGSGGANMELDVYAGFKPVTGPVSWDIGVIGYLYPGASDDGAEFDYWEVYAKPSISVAEGATVGAAVYYSPEFTGESGDGLYYEVNGAVALSDVLSISGAIGQQQVDQSGFFAGEDSYTTYNVGGTLTAMGLGFDLRYVGTDVDNAPVYDDRIVFSIKKAM